MRNEDTKTERPVEPAKLIQLIEEADRVVVKESPLVDSKILYESKNRTDLDDLKRSLSVEIPKKWFHCMCIGTPAIYIYSGEEKIVQVTNHHGTSIRCSLWDSDARIVDIDSWLSWFDARGIDKPREEVAEMLVREEESQKNSKKWMAAMPAGLQPLWEDSLGQFGDVNTTPLRNALRNSIPNKYEQIKALLSWFGSGAGPWSGFPAYESAAEELLLDYNISELIDALDTSKLTPELVEGAARLFGGWSFSRKHPKGIKCIPKDLKRILWDCVKNTKDTDKRRRAKRTFK